MGGGATDSPSSSSLSRKVDPRAHCPNHVRRPSQPPPPQKNEAKKRSTFRPLRFFFLLHPNGISFELSPCHVWGNEVRQLSLFSSLRLNEEHGFALPLAVRETLNCPLPLSLPLRQMRREGNVFSIPPFVAKNTQVRRRRKSFLAAGGREGDTRMATHPNHETKKERPLYIPTMTQSLEWDLPTNFKAYRRQKAVCTIVRTCM